MELQSKVMNFQFNRATVYDMDSRNEPILHFDCCCYCCCFGHENGGSANALCFAQASISRIMTGTNTWTEAVPIQHIRILIVKFRC